MADNPKSLASLADDLERLNPCTTERGFKYRAVGDDLWEAVIAALRAPTPNAMLADDALLSARAKILAWVGHVAFEQPDYSTMEEEVTRLAREILALSTPSPTITENKETYFNE